MSRFTAFRRPLAAFAGASLFAVAVGAVVCALSGVAAGVWGRNLAAWVVGALAAAALSRWAGERTLRAILLVTPLGLAAPMLGEGQQGVHRWLELGPLYVNAAMLMLPAFVVALAVVAGDAAGWWIAAMLTLVVLVVQPDASQATAFAVALWVILPRMRTPSARSRWAIALLALLLAAMSWTRPDPLAPVPEVEEVVRLAAMLSPLLAAVAILPLVVFAATPVLATRGSSTDGVRWAGRALSVLFLAWSAAPALGAFPTPLVGAAKPEAVAQRTAMSSIAICDSPSWRWASRPGRGRTMPTATAIMAAVAIKAFVILAWVPRPGLLFLSKAKVNPGQMNGRQTPRSRR